MCLTSSLTPFHRCLWCIGCPKAHQVTAVDLEGEAVAGVVEVLDVVLQEVVVGAVVVVHLS